MVLYDAHSILSIVPRLFDGVLPQYNIGTNFGVTCDPALTETVVTILAKSGRSHVLDGGRFRGGWTTRHYGWPADHIHAIQMELAMRGYMAEPAAITPETRLPGTAWRRPARSGEPDARRPPPDPRSLPRLRPKGLPVTRLDNSRVITPATGTTLSARAPHRSTAADAYEQPPPRRR